MHAGLRVPADIAVAVAEHLGADQLTARELEALMLVAAAMQTRPVAAAASMSEETVKGHVKRILAKPGANDRTHAVAITLRRSIFALGDLK